MLKCLAELGAEVMDADRVAREVVAPGTPALEKIVGEFGSGILDEKGELDRAAMASIVFKDPGARSRLENIIHPEVFSVIGRRISEYREGRGAAPALVVEVPLLIESGMNRMMDETWVLVVDPREQVKRVMARSGLSREEVLERLKAQMPQEEKARYADRVIDNSGPVEDTIKQVKQAWDVIMKEKRS